MNAGIKIDIGCILVLAAVSAHAATTHAWDSAKPAGDLMDGANYTSGTEPAADDSLNVNIDVKPGIDGTFTLSKDTPHLDKTTFGHANGAQNRALDIGERSLTSTYLQFRYSDLMTIRSGTYHLNSLCLGDSTSNGDTTRVTVTGADTAIYVTPGSLGTGASVKIGTGSAEVGQSKGELTLTGGALIESQASLTLGTAGGWKNKLTVSGEGTRLVVTNAAQKQIVCIGGQRQACNSGDGYFYSQTNSLTVTDHASLVADDLDVGFQANCDAMTVGNTLTVSDCATARARWLRVIGTNTLTVTSHGRIATDEAHLGYWGYQPAERGNPTGAGARTVIADGGILDVGTRLIVGSTYKDSTDAILTVGAGGLVRSPLTEVGSSTIYHKDCILNVEAGGVMTNGTFYVNERNRAIVAGAVAVTNTLYVGRTSSRAGSEGGSLLHVTGGTFRVNGQISTYIGDYKRLAPGNAIVVSDGGLFECNGANYVLVGYTGRDCSLTVTGAGTRFVHNAYSTAQTVDIGIAVSETLDGVDLSQVYQGNNRLTVSDGAAFQTSASVNLTRAPDSLMVVDQGIVRIAADLNVSKDGATFTNEVLRIAGSRSRVTVGGRLRIGNTGTLVFDLSDGKAPDAALVQLAQNPVFYGDAKIYITSSNPALLRKTPRFNATLMDAAGQAAPIPFQNVTVEVDPALTDCIRVRQYDHSLAVRAGGQPGVCVIFR